MSAPQAFGWGFFLTSLILEKKMKGWSIPIVTE
jgi:hypothetical protein